MIAYGSYEVELDLERERELKRQTLQVPVYQTEEELAIQDVQRFLNRQKSIIIYLQCLTLADLFCSNCFLQETKDKP